MECFLTYALGWGEAGVPFGKGVSRLSRLLGG
jgi:hypothetical protein